MASSLDDHNRSGFMRANQQQHLQQLQQIQLQQHLAHQQNFQLQNHFQFYPPNQHQFQIHHNPHQSYINSIPSPSGNGTIVGSNGITPSNEPSNQYYYNVYLGIYNQINNLCQKVNIQEEKLLFLQSIAKQNDDKFKEIESQLISLSQNIVGEDKFKDLGMSPLITTSSPVSSSTTPNGSTGSSNSSVLHLGSPSGAQSMHIPCQSSSVSPILPPLALPLAQSPHQQPLMQLSPHQQPQAQLVLSPQQKILNSPQLPLQQLQQTL
ncbi:expressed protein [Dictyostelium purpureum]|uniref:Expressed protein n=1 Tax=Dictyostelium purpureum TaxID=5786 RepID=F1A1Y0_DICPU|nr:uncharacterized protein DICPUDRAFT_93095 [Dictyostelium purpureum]EGC29809.1 expressed protein [Dictyostelium purpureum]|eukprot:XP_003293674.1 expressed protein [Dictyostelium purpureum]